MSAVSTLVAIAGDHADWNQFVDDQPQAEIYHRYEWKNLLESVFGHNCYYLIARDDSGIVQGVLPLAHLESRTFGSFLVSIPCFNYCGVLATNSNVRETMIAKAVNLG